MSVLNTIRDRITLALREHDSVTKNVLRLVVGEVDTLASSVGQGTKPVSEDQIHKIIRKLILANQETMQHLTGDRRAILERENQLLEIYLPKQLSRDEIKAKLAVVLDEIRAAKSDGQATGIAMKLLKHGPESADGNDVKAVIEELRA